MSKKTIDLTTEREVVGTLHNNEPTVIRVRLLREYGGRGHYYMDGWPWPVPPVLRHLDGRSGRSVIMAAVVALAAAAALWARLAGR